jgi:orotate phosphoribosyltransferase
VALDREALLTSADDLAADITRRLAFRRGHFVMESGLHSAHWIDLAMLCLRPDELRPHAAALAARLTAHAVEVVCGPLVEGAFVALMVAAERGRSFTYTDPEKPEGEGLYRATYRLPPVLAPVVRGRRVAIVNDVISAGSAVRGTHVELLACGAEVVTIASLAVLGDAAIQWCDAEGLALEALARLPFEMWPPASCPLCAAGVPLTDERYTRRS